MQVAAELVADAIKSGPGTASGPADSSILPLPAPLELCIDGHDSYQAIAVRQLPGQQLEYLAAPPGQSLDWHKAAKITGAMVVPPGAHSEFVGLPAPTEVRSGRRVLSAIAVRLTDGLPEAYLAGGSRGRFEWIDAREVTAS
ncbi:hypothetical protein E4P41_15085 [Geodermatophilus sp. DF01-2]|uniref:hypothetical protein n=1 Tax=Geodermatophilus sp. DF01-2 TaxID=2559610 RepID=UPI0010736649|nr:hypothetical protein [Geodermatophilus sp. DF01_2]TFV57024.1 hypothetical protein E4P41_15085 [Geodermatophilus sp. DF01_2]